VKLLLLKTIQDNLNLILNLVNKHFLLICDLMAVLSLWNVVFSVYRSDPTPDEVGIALLLSIYSTLQSRPNTSRR